MSRRVSNIAARLFALIALCVQLASSVGHVHASADHEVNAAAVHCIEADGDHCEHPAHDEDEPECPVCEAMTLVAYAVVPGSPEIAQPVLCDLTTEPPGRVQIALSEAVANFQARAPPRL